jgi:hypothetical protein
MDNEKEYLSGNYCIIDTKNNNFDFSSSFSKEHLDNISILFTAELHGIAINKVLEFLFLKYFVDHYDFKYILAELPLSHAEMLNKFLLEQNDDILIEYFNFIKGTNVAMNENFIFWQNVRDYNNSLPENKKIEIIGVDIEFQPGLAIKWIRDNYLDTDIPDEIQTDINLLKNADIYNSSYSWLREICNQINTNINNSSIAYQQYFGQNYFNTKLILENVVNVGLASEKYSNDKDKWNNFRDSIITMNFLSIDERIADGKYIGQWGMHHTFQRSTFDINWFASKLQQTDKFNEKILSCIFCYENSNCRKKSGEIEFLNTQPRSGYYSFTNTEEPVIFNLIKKDSPYLNNLYKITTEIKEENSGVTTDYFQYMVLIINGEPSTIYE